MCRLTQPGPRNPCGDCISMDERASYTCDRKTELGLFLARFVVPSGVVENEQQKRWLI